MGNEEEKIRLNRKKLELINRNYPYNPFPAKILGIKRHSADMFTIILDTKMKHEPGQFVQLALLGIGECPISICSYSNEFLELTIHEVGAVTKSLSNMKNGDTVFIRGPYGNGYPMQKLKGKNLVIVGGGCGVAPLKGMLSYVEQHRKHYNNVELFFGYRSPDSILFQDDIRRWDKEFKLHLTVDKTDGSEKTCYAGSVGFVTDLLKKTGISSKNSGLFMCGPPVMMKFCISILKEKGFDEKQIYISAERLMYCAFGLCCHCMIKGKLTCLDGPVFRLDQVQDALEEEH